MTVFPYTGPSYQYRDYVFDAQRSVNQFTVKSEVGDSKAMNGMIGTPGYALFCNTGPDGVRGEWTVRGRCFVVMGSTLYEIFADGTKISKGTLLTQYGAVSMNDNGLQLIVSDGPNGYVLVLALNQNTIINGTFDADTNWTKGAGWTIAAGVASAGAAINTDMSQVQGGLIPGASYQVVFTATRSAGSVTPVVGGTAGTARSADGTYTETIVAGADGTFEFETAGFTGTVDNVTLISVADSFLAITASGWLGSDSFAFVDGYFIANKPNSATYYISGLYNGTAWDPLDFATAEGSTDNLVAVHSVHKQLWLFKKGNIEVCYDSGATFPFSPIAGGYIEYGCVAAKSIQSIANTVFWLGSDTAGQGVVWMASGYQPSRKSTGPIETAIHGYGDISDTVGFSYQEDGHYFYALNFTNAATTWVYDISVDQWHERAYWDIPSGRYLRDRPQFHVFAFGKHLVGDYANGNIYEQSLSYYTHNGNPIRRLRAAPHIQDDLEYIYHERFQLDMMVGQGLTSGNDADVNPRIILQWSDDAGMTWGNEHSMPVGARGNYKTRVIWRRLGRSRDRIYRTIYTAETPFFVVAAHLDFAKGEN